MGTHLHTVDNAIPPPLGDFEPRCEEPAILLIGAVYASCHMIIDQPLSAEQAIELYTGVFTVVLCGLGMAEE